MAKEKETFESNQREIEKLQEEIIFCDMSLRHKNNSVKADSYYLKAVALAKLGKLTGDNAKLHDALICYNEAINLAPKTKCYYADRSKLYVEMGETEKAVADIEKIKKIPSKKDESTEDIYTNIAVKAIVELDQVQNKIKELAIEGKIGEELAKELIEYAKVSKEFAQTFNKDPESIKKINEIISELKISKEQLDALRRENVDMKEQIEAHTGQIVGIKKKLSFLDSLTVDLHKKVEEAAKSPDELKNMKQELSLMSDSVKHIEAMASQYPEQVKVVNMLVNDVHLLIVNKGVTMSTIQMIHEKVNSTEEELKSTIEIQEKQGENLKQYDIKLKAHDAKFIKIEKAAEALKAGLDANDKVKSEDKKIIENRIDAIMGKIKDFASQKDVEVITQRMMELISESEITEERLGFIEKDLDNILDSQQESSDTVNMLDNIVYDNNDPAIILGGLMNLQDNQ